MIARSLQRSAEITLLLVQRDFKGRYKHTRVGMLWSILNPLMFLCVFYFVFKVVLEIDVPRYASFVFIGILVWGWTQASLMQAVGSISSNPGLVSQPGFPVAALPAIATLSALLNLAVAVPVLIAILVIEGAHASPALIALPAILALNLGFALGLAYLLAAANVTFRDVEHVLPIFLQVGYYATPIFYDIDKVPAAHRWLFEINPMFHIIDAYRSVLMHGQFPAAGPFAAIAAVTLLLLGAGRYYFDRARYRFLEEI